MNRCIDGDVVAVEVFPESEWRAPADEVVDQDGMKAQILRPAAIWLIGFVVYVAALKNDDPDNSDAEEGEGVDDSEERLLQRELRQSAKTTKKAASEKQPTGKVVGVIKRNWRA